MPLDPNLLPLYTALPPGVQPNEDEPVLVVAENEYGALLVPAFASVGALTLYTGGASIWLRWRAAELIGAFVDNSGADAIVIDSCAPSPLTLEPATARAYLEDPDALFASVASLPTILPVPAPPRDGEAVMFVPGEPFVWDGQPAFAARRLVNHLGTITLGAFHYEEDLHAAFPAESVVAQPTTMYALAQALLHEDALGELVLHGRGGTPTQLTRTQVVQMLREGFDAVDQLPDRVSVLRHGAPTPQELTAPGSAGRRLQSTARRACEAQPGVKSAYLLDVQVGDGDPILTIGLELVAEAEAEADENAVAHTIGAAVQPLLGDGVQLNVMFLGHTELTDARAVGLELVAPR